MFNRYLYEKLQTEVFEKDKIAKLQHQLKMRRKNIIETSVKNYKTKVKNFLLQLASNPVQLGQYDPPVQTIQRSTSTVQILGLPQMSINGFKTNKERTEKAENNNKIFDYSPTRIPFKNPSFRKRNTQKQIQPQMHFLESSRTYLNNTDKEYSRKSQQKSLKNLKLPSISQVRVNPQKKTYFKAIEQMGNSLKTMQQTKSDRIGLENRLMVVMDGKQINIESTAIDLLVKSNMLKKRVNSQRLLKSFKSLQMNL